jgi:hypothetical protein
MVVNLGRNVVKRVSNLVCEAFNGTRTDGRMQVAHNDGDSTNDTARNLRWATPAENCHDQLLHGTRRMGATKWGAKLTEHDVIEITAMRQSGMTLQSIADKFCVSRATATRICSGKKWQHVTQIGCKDGA